MNGLLDVQARFIGHHFQLAAFERTLCRRAGRRRPKSQSAIRLIELERQRLGRDLHTGVGQLLAAIRLQLEIILGQLPDPPAMVRQALGRISTLAAEALEQVRSLSSRIYPPDWQRLSFEAALQQLWRMTGIEARFEAELTIAQFPAEPNLEIKILMYRAAQEALSNVLRHARATRVRLAVTEGSRSLQMTVTDNGVGFEAEKLLYRIQNGSSGIGIRSIREQAESMGGNLLVQSGPLGTKLEITVPYSRMQHG